MKFRKMPRSCTAGDVCMIDVTRPIGIHGETRRGIYTWNCEL